jgi:hypothetical protein
VTRAALTLISTRDRRGQSLEKSLALCGSFLLHACIHDLDGARFPLQGSPQGRGLRCRLPQASLKLVRGERSVIKSDQSVHNQTELLVDQTRCLTHRLLNRILHVSFDPDRLRGGMCGTRAPGRERRRGDRRRSQFKSKM